MLQYCHFVIESKESESSKISGHKEIQPLPYHPIVLHAITEEKPEWVISASCLGSISCCKAYNSSKYKYITSLLPYSHYCPFTT